MNLEEERAGSGWRSDKRSGRVDQIYGDTLPCYASQSSEHFIDLQKGEKMRLILIRGLPGSGKTTLAMSLRNFEHLEADQFFVNEYGKYVYQRDKIQEAHTWCQRKASKALSEGKRVVVSNTFTRISELEPYFQIAKNLGITPTVVEVMGNWPNVHGVPAEVIDRMRQRWEPFTYELPLSKPYADQAK